MSIFLREHNSENGKKITLLETDGCDHSFLLNAIPDIQKKDNYYISEEKLWDCVADLSFEDIICRMKTGNKMYSGQLVIQGKPGCSSDFFSPEGMISFLWDRNQRQRGKFQIMEKGMRQMGEFQYHLECPLFDEGDMCYPNAKETVREYSHPIDTKMIAVLDNPAVNAVFRIIADAGADSSMGQMLASGIPLNRKNYPEIDEIIRQCSEKLGIRRPYAIISHQLPGINAMTIGSDEEPYLVLSSLLVKALSTDQLKFVIGHECGHIAMGHVVYHSAVAAAGSLSRLIPLIGPAMYRLVSYPMNAWERRSEITADRAGLICCENLELAQRTLLQITSAYQKADRLDIDAYVANSCRYLRKGVLRKIGEYGANHPLIFKRIQALNEFANSQCYFKLTNQRIMPDALTDKQLQNATEQIIKVL